MNDFARYMVPAARHRVERTIERSRFICTIQRVADASSAQALLRELNVEFQDATHNCWAYVAGSPGSTSVIGMSDAGEPHGTAGRPMLTVLLHSGVGEIGAVVTRYYGGTKLGTGGLVKAYGGIVQLALEELTKTEWVDYVDVVVSVGYPSVSAIQRVIASLGAEVVEQEYGAEVSCRLRVPRANVAELRTTLADATSGEGRLRLE